MLNQFYNYMAKKLINYLKQEKVKAGERYFLQFDELDNVRDFYSVLKSSEIAHPFIYQHKQGSPYETFYLDIHGIRVIIAATINGVTPDYLVTIRNLVSEQSGEGVNTALISMSHLSLDSIQGGSKDLQSKGMPFNIRMVTQYIKDELNDGDSFSIAEKEIIHFHLDKKLEDLVVQTTIWDYAEVISLFYKGKIEQSDFKTLNLFPDPELNKGTYIKPAEIQARLQENSKLYELVQRIHDYETLDTELDKYFDDKMVVKLKKDDWYTNDLMPVKTSFDNNQKIHLSYLDAQTKKLNKEVDFWERAHAKTKTGMRKRHIIVFNEPFQSSVEMEFEFDDHLKKQYIHKKSEPYCETSGRKLKVTLPVEDGKVQFHQIKYRHNNESKSSYEFNFCIVPFSPDILSGIETKYEVKYVAANSSIFLHYTGEEFVIGSGEASVHHLIREAYETIEKDEGVSVALEMDQGAWEDDRLAFNMKVHQSFLPFEIRDSDVRSTPIEARRVAKLKREKRAHFVLEHDTIRQETSTYYPHDDFKTKLLIEQKWVNSFAKQMVRDSLITDMELPENVLQAYEAYLAYFSTKQLLPSLSYMDDELKKLAKSYITHVSEHIAMIEEDTLLTERQLNLFKLGTFIDNERLWLTPVHPLNVAYQLYLEEQLQDEELDYVILNRLHPNNLLPFIYAPNDELYRPTLTNKFAEWHEYEPEKQISIGTANEFLAKVVEEKIKQFVTHFDYLFLSSSKSPLLLNVVEINNDKEVVRGIFNFMKEQLETVGPDNILPIEVALYRSHDSQSSFELLSAIETAADLKEEFNIDINSKDLDAADVLRLIRENIRYYQNETKDNMEFHYSHISFFKLPTQDIEVSHPMNQMDTGISLNGLLSSVAAISSESDYRTGFGLLNGPERPSYLVEIASGYNELAFNMKNEGKSSYSKNKSIVMSTSSHNQELLKNLYKASFWVTFIEPGVDLDFFQDSTNELLVIHYNDQHTSSDRYDAITVTDKSNQYKKVIKEYIHDHSSTISDYNIDQAIKAFNSINGEWLLRIIGSKGHFAREKISIVSAMKYLECYLYHPSITWVPVSLEEILRVAAAVNLTKRDGIFSTKNLKSFGKHSDDILMMGIEEREGRLMLYLYPVEVKIGRLQTSKAHIQIEKTAALFKEFLIDKPGEHCFRKKFYRNFFAQILLSNAKKIYSNGLWTKEKYDQIHELKALLLNDDFTIGEHLEAYIGKGAVLHFRNNSGFRTAELNNEILNLMFIEEDAYAGLSTSMETIVDKMKTGYMDFIPRKLLANQYHPDSHVYVSPDYQDSYLVDMSEDNYADSVTKEEDENQSIQHDEVAEDQSGNEYKASVDNHDEVYEVESANDDVYIEQIEDVVINEEENQPSDLETQVSLEDIRVPIGVIQGSNQVVNWEFGHKNLANRHLFITGGSGQGKTYFIQCLLWELAKHDISSIIIDYTDGFKKSQLEEEFKENLGDRLEQFIVLAKKFPINPFKRNKKELDEDLFIDEDDSDVAERMKNVIGSIYTTLGPQQLNSIYQAVMKGMSIYDEKMNFEILRELLEEDGSGPAKTALSQMNLLIDKNPFDSSQDMDWSFLEKEKGKVFIIQLTGYSPDVQKLITEFILWDLWYYKLQHGNKRTPFPAVLDESQRLDFSNNSPSAKILTEGRKFGWSGWFATQSTKGFSGDQISRLQNSAVKIYFSPVENEISTIAANIAADHRERKEWETKLTNLQKGQCIVYGPVLDRNGKLLPSRPYVVNISPFSER
ncbi:DNA phosphorothioation-dependent restriction protein DptH [Pradoshia eiseniae]|nr:DNA phosphorothioation-dependent restriction protein DptH [Pradoshia eiseniae]